MFETILRQAVGGARHLALASLAVIALASTAQAQRIDCPLRNERYSLESPAIEILLKPEARAVIERARPGLLASIPERFVGTTPPTFGAILPIRTVLAMAQLDAESVTRVDAELRALRVTNADRVARCARYDVERPSISFAEGRPRILLFEKMTGFRDGPSVEAARAAFAAMAERNNWSLVVTDRGGAIAPSVLRNVDVIIWNNVSGDVLTMTQRRALQRWVEGGGGFVAVHGSGGDPMYLWDWYVDTLIGARFIGHPMNPQFQDARVIVHDDAPLARDLAPGWTMNDEWYSFASNPAANGARVIASLDESTYSPVGRDGQELRMGAHPIAWTKCVGDGRSFYSAIGHRPETYSDANHVRMLEQAITWAAGNGATTCDNGREAPRG
jgi:type 1 glutamine amidotransferase